MTTETERALREMPTEQGHATQIEYCLVVFKWFTENQIAIRQALQQNEKLVGALKYIASDQYTDQNVERAKQALAEYEKGE